ncbi:MAG: hypothetical protein R3F22_04290 [Lysobacteraceae bacterium]
MSEHMDVRVRAGRRIPSNAGDGDGFIVAARTSGAFSFGFRESSVEIIFGCSEHCE